MVIFPTGSSRMCVSVFGREFHVASLSFAFVIYVLRRLLEYGSQPRPAWLVATSMTLMQISAKRVGHLRLI